MKTKGLLIYSFSILLLSFSALALNWMFLYPFIIPDPCYYHNRETSWLFRLFFDLPASEGYHPVPSLFNLALTTVVGIVCGFLVARYILKKLV